MRIKFKKCFYFLTAALFAACMAPAQAFYLEVPKSVNENFNNLKKSIVRPQVLGETASSDANQPVYERIMEPKMEPKTETCNINGVEMQGSCESYNSGSGQSSSGQQYYNEKDDEERQRKNEEKQKQDQERWLNDMKRGNKDMERNISRLSSAFKKAEKSGTIIPDEIKDQLNKAVEIINALKAAQTAEEMQNIDMQELGDIMRSLDESREVLIDQAQRLKDMKKGLKDMARELGKFEKQIGKLKSQKIVIPETLPAALSKIKSAVSNIQNAKTWEEAQTAGIEDMRELWETLDENRRQLEMISRWPQTLKEIDKQLKQMDKELQRMKKAVDKAIKSGLDIAEPYSDFEDAVNKLKSAKSAALAKMSESDGEAAFEIIENDFFNQTEDVWALHRIAAALSDFAQFKSVFKKELNSLHSMMMKLKRQKIDVSALEKTIIYATATGNKIESLLKAKPVDLDQVIDLLHELENLKQEFYENADEFTGAEKLMPWENGPVLFKTPELPDSVNKVISKDSACDCKCEETKKPE